ncbi:MAG: aldolase [Planctomycetes bacterium]|nr:aldolase [Planctomycetota bacterium]
MRKSRIKMKLSRGEPVLVTTLHLIDPSVYELTSLMGFDGIWMDLEHHTYSVQTASELMRAARVGSADIIARPAKGEFMRMQRLLEAGAQGIMYPRCDDAREAAEVVSWAKFAPIGRRGIDAANPDAPYLSMPLADYIVEANRQTFLIVQIETPEALERVEEIAAVDGVDILLFGPGDFSILSGIPGQMDHERIREAKQRIAEAARSAGKHWGYPVGSVQEAQELLEMGGRFICYQADIVMIKNGLEQVQREMAPLGFTFDNRLA